MKNSKRRLGILALTFLMLIVASLSITMTACKTPEAQSYTVTYSTENALYGSVSGSCESGEEVKGGTSVTLTATPEDEYSFTGWYVGNTLKSNANPYTFSASEEISLVAKFEYAGHVCSYTEHLSYSKEEDVDNEIFKVYRTMKCDCGQTQTAEITDYTLVDDAYTLRTKLQSTGVKNRLIVLNNGWQFGYLELGLDYFDEGLTIIGKEGTTMNGFMINSGKGENDANASTDVMPSRVTFIGIEFINDLHVVNCSMDRLTIKDCTFIDGAGINIRANSWTGVDEVNARPLGKRNTISNTTIEGCTFERYAGVTNKTKIAMYDINGVTIKNNTISSCDYNAIQLNSRSLDGVYGDIIIEGNTISETYSRAIRITNIKRDIYVKDNTFSNINTSGNDNGQIFKANTKSDTTLIVFTGNTLDGSSIEVDDPKVVWENVIVE